jgi:FMN phosphatase YigB (HAD superfamily)
LTDDEVIECFGGPARLQLLQEWLRALISQGSRLAILSCGRQEAILSLLRRSGIPANLFRHIWCSDMPEMQAFASNKAELMREYLRSKNIAPSLSLFVDDTLSHITASANVCATYHVRASGLAEDEMREIVQQTQLQWFGGDGTNAPVAKLM